MSDLTPHDPRLPASDRVARLPNLERYLDLDLSITAAAIGVMPGERLGFGFSICHLGRTRLIADVENYSQKLDQQIASAIPTEAIERCRDMLRDAASTKPNRKVTMAAVSLFVSARVKQPPNPETFIQALAYDLTTLGFSPAVVVVALQRLRREAKFFPEIPEVITACEAERNRYRAMLDRIDSTARYRVALEQARADVPRLMLKAEASPEESCVWHGAETNG